MSLPHRTAAALVALGLCPVALAAQQPAAGMPDMDQTYRAVFQFMSGMLQFLQPIAIALAVAFGIWMLFQGARQGQVRLGGQGLLLLLLAGFAYAPAEWIRMAGMEGTARTVEELIGRRPVRGSYGYAEERTTVAIRTETRGTVTCVGYVKPADALLYFCDQHVGRALEEGRALPDTMYMRMQSSGEVVPYEPETRRPR